MKKILLIAINTRYTHSCLALYCLKSFAAGLDCDIIIREYSIKSEIKTIIADIIAGKPDAVALSVYIWNVDMVQKILSTIKVGVHGIRIILGGPEVSYNPEIWLSNYPQIDHIITGHGEKGFRSLLEHGLALRKKIIGVSNPSFRDMPAPYSQDDMSNLKKKYIYYESSRGCPFKCSYCLSSRSDQRLEMKSLDNVKRELECIIAHKPILVKFIDRTFNVGHKHYRGIWNFLLDTYASEPTTYHFEIHPLHLDDEDLAILSSCPENLFQFEIGVQTINPETRAAVGRAGDWHKEKAMIRRLVNHTNIRIHLDLIVGLPDEDIDSIKSGINELFSLNPDHLQIGFLKVLPGTELQKQADEYGIVYSKTAPYQVLENRRLGRKELKVLERIAFLTDRLYNTRRFTMTLSCLARNFESPFDMYKEMASHLDFYGKSISRKWKTGAGFLIDFIASRLAHKKAFFLDTIRWDWCTSSLSHRYPDIIRPHGSAEIKQAGSAFFGKLAKDECIRYGGITFRSRELKSSIFFKAESEVFKQEFMNKNRYALFLSKGNDIVFYNL